MSVESVFATTRFGLEFERLRLEAASHNIAVANTPSAAGRSAQIMRAVPNAVGGFNSAIGNLSGVGQPALISTDVASREVHDPSDPAADKNGMVTYPRIDLVQEMSTLVEAERSYEANVRAFNALRGMELHALDIGNNS